MKNSISYGELVTCQNYAEEVLDFYRLHNNGSNPMFRDDAEMAVLEYNEKYCNGAMNGYVDEVVICMGFMIEQ